jgi:hypothetical protein
MNTFEEAFRIAIEKHMNTENKKVESYTLHPSNLIKMIKGKENAEKIKYNTTGVSGQALFNK